MSVSNRPAPTSVSPQMPQFLRAASSVGGQARHIRVQRRSLISGEWELVGVFRRAEDAEARASQVAAEGAEVRLVSFLYCPSAR